MADKPAPKPGHFLPGGAGTDDSADGGSSPLAAPAKCLTLWTNQGFASADPGTCNTFVAASAKVG